MLSKNNFKERLRKMEPRKERFSIRKFSVGAASVLIGFFFMGMDQGQTVRAADTTQNDVNVEQSSSTQKEDANKYQPEYGEKTVTQGSSVDDPATWSTADGNQGNPVDHGSSAKFKSMTGTPEWATGATDGTITLAPTTSVEAGTYVIPVLVTYGDGTSEKAYAPVTITGVKHDDDNNIWVYGQNTQSSFRIGTFDTHKTNDGSANAMEIVAAPKLDLIKFTNQAYNKDTHQYKDVSSVTYTLNPDKTQYVATLVTINGQTFTGNAITRDLLCQVKSSAVLSFDVDQVQTSWMPASDQWAQGKDRRANTDASNFASGTGTSLANSQYGDPNGDQRSKSPEQLAGNSRARANINLSGDAAG
ncbi:MAG: Rib/alpha-like domain-containing protein [Lactobacillus amylovorus]|uniref:Surface protein n=4 Tax=Lactobacillus TaxID=1578 RepID=E4SMC3_LACAR|nr:Rib/alpha-like domain-containing protein [Lactobacillus amylovorus]HBQ08122.1 YSIRK-type signal peptide-containing protein [Lactobacillus sp.]ADQ59748.1 surface protein [Lactobacillus amylovorus GRL 1112]MCT3596796.1 YSIRK-type signal peptide-containing protein [Lactobacillus amylovorus]MDY2786390.1 Rib/alpha-like domain-containing protein [Lactobacillus amylovorus]MDY4728685.1 Rib/alpha-like domain-containing protein [Lactobacillus amylovorus]